MSEITEAAVQFKTEIEKDKNHILYELSAPYDDNKKVEESSLPTEVEEVKDIEPLSGGLPETVKKENTKK